MKKNTSKVFLAIIFVGLMLRLYLAQFGLHDDIYSLAAWGDWIYFHGPADFYTHNQWVYAWPTQTPLASLMFAFARFLYYKGLGLVALVHSVFSLKLNFSWLTTLSNDLLNQYFLYRLPLTEYQYAYVYIIKLFSVAADIGIAAIIYLVAKLVRPRFALLYPALYIFSPFSLYLSSFWGQTDPQGFFFLLLSFLLIYLKKFRYLSPALYVVSIAIKPTSLVFAPIYAFYYFRSRPRYLEIILSSTIAAVVLLYPNTFFTQKNQLNFILDDLYRIMFLKSEIRLTTNSFNFWHIFTGNTPHIQTYKILGLPANIWAYLLFALNYLYAIKVALIKKTSFFLPLFIIGTSAFLFLPNMLERYIFNGLIFGLLLLIYHPSVLKYWLLMTIIFLLNLYHSWWFPFPTLQPLFELPFDIFTKSLSLLNVVLYLMILFRIRKLTT